MCSWVGICWSLPCGIQGGSSTHGSENTCIPPKRRQYFRNKRSPSLPSSGLSSISALRSLRQNARKLSLLCAFAGAEKVFVPSNRTLLSNDSPGLLEKESFTVCVVRQWCDLKDQWDLRYQGHRWSSADPPPWLKVSFLTHKMRNTKIYQWATVYWVQ